MPFKMFASAQNAPSTDKPDEKSKETPEINKPAPQPDKAPAEVEPARKP